MGRVLRAGNHADRGEYDAGSLERGRARAGAVSGRCGSPALRRWSRRGGASATRRRRCSNVRRRPVWPWRPSTSSRCWLLARRHATRCAPWSPRKGLRPRTSWSAQRPADPLRGDVVVMTRDEYYVGRFHWLGKPRVSLDGERVPRPRGPVYEAAARDPIAQRFLVWARYPAIDVEAAPSGGTLVQFSDVRYRAADRLSGPVVRAPRQRDRPKLASAHSSARLRRGMSSTRSVH